MKNGKLSKAQIAQIITARRAGEKLEALAADYDVSASTIAYHLRKAGIGAWEIHSGRGELDPAEAATLYKDGASLEALALHYSCARVTVRSHLEKTGVELRVAYRRDIPLDMELVRELYEQDRLTLKQVAERVGASLSTIQRRLELAGVARRNKRGRAR